MMNAWQQKVRDGERLSEAEALALFSEDLAPLARSATLVRNRFHDNHATFVIDLNLNFTNICSCDCGFCAFQRRRDAADAFVMDQESVLERVRGLAAIGGTQVLMQGGINHDLGLDYYTGLLQAVRREFPDLAIHSFSPPEIAALADREHLSVRRILAILRAAGLDSLPGGGAEILVDRVRHILSPGKISAGRWLEVMRTAHAMGIPTTATMMFGAGETLQERIAHLRVIRDLQDETGGFRAFIPWSFCPENTRFSQTVKAGGAEYLKMLAISRIFLDNIPNLGAGWLTEGMGTAQLGLLAGANDMGGILMEEKVLEATAVRNRTNVRQLTETIRGAGFIPAQRDTAYRILREFPADHAEDADL